MLTGFIETLSLEQKRGENWYRPTTLWECWDPVDKQAKQLSGRIFANVLTSCDEKVCREFSGLTQWQILQRGADALRSKRTEVLKWYLTITGACGTTSTRVIRELFWGRMDEAPTGV